MSGDNPTGRTGSYPSAARPSPVPAPPAGSPERDRWIDTELRTARKEAGAALDAVFRIEDSVGYSPDPAKGIKEGKGIAGQLSVLIEQNAHKERNTAARRNILIGVASTVGALGALIGIIKALIEVFRR